MSVYMSVEYTIYALHGVRVCVCNHHNSHELNNLLKQTKCEWCFDNWIQSPHGVTSFMCPRCCVMPLSMASKSRKRRGRKLKKKLWNFRIKLEKFVKLDGTLQFPLKEVFKLTNNKKNWKKQRQQQHKSIVNYFGIFDILIVRTR